MQNSESRISKSKGKLSLKGKSLENFKKTKIWKIGATVTV